MKKSNSKKTRFLVTGMSAALVASAIAPALPVNIANADDSVPVSDGIVKASEMSIGEVVQVGTVDFVKYAETVDYNGEKISLFAQIAKHNAVFPAVGEEGYNMLNNTQGLNYTNNNTKVLYNPILESGIHRGNTTEKEKEETIKYINELYKNNWARTAVLKAEGVIKNQSDTSDTKNYVANYVSGNENVIYPGEVGFSGSATQEYKDKTVSVLNLPTDLYTELVKRYEAAKANGTMPSWQALSTSKIINIEDVQAIIKNYELGLIDENNMPTYFGLDQIMSMGTVSGDTFAGTSKLLFSNYAYTKEGDRHKLTKVTNSKPTFTLKLQLRGDTEFYETGNGKYEYVSKDDNPASMEAVNNSNSAYKTISLSSDSDRKLTSLRPHIVGFFEEKHELIGMEVYEAISGKTVEVPLSSNGAFDFSDERISITSINNTNMNVFEQNFYVSALRNGSFQLRGVFKNKQK